MSSGNLLEAYNIPFYEPRIIYEEQVQYTGQSYYL